jgi:hypothetical protein
VHRLLTTTTFAATACSIPSATFLGTEDAGVLADARPDARDAGPCGNGMVDLGEDCDGESGCSATCTVPAPANAAAIRFVATVIEVSDPAAALVPAIALGQQTWGRFVYSFGLTDATPDPTRGDYTFTNPVLDTTGIFARLASWTFRPASGNGGILMLDEPTDVLFAITGNLGVAPQIVALQDVTLQLNDDTGTALASDALPHEPFPLVPAWSSAVVRFRGDNGTIAWMVTARIDSLGFERN